MQLWTVYFFLHFELSGWKRSFIFFSVGSITALSYFLLPPLSFTWHRSCILPFLLSVRLLYVELLKWRLCPCSLWKPTPGWHPDHGRLASDSWGSLCGCVKALSMAWHVVDLLMVKRHYHSQRNSTSVGCGKLHCESII